MREEEVSCRSDCGGEGEFDKKSKMVVLFLKFLRL